MTNPFPESYRAPFTPKPDPELIEEVRSGSMKERLRARAVKDRFFLAKGVLGYNDVNAYTHGPLCRALDDRSKKRRLYLMHRGSLKTTLGTITDSIGDGLADPDNTRILIVNEVEANAIGFLSEIKAHFENNDLLRELFPELIPQKFGGPGSKWSTNQACLNRSTSYKEWTWSAAGVGSAKTGNHYTKIKCDDLIGFDAKESPAAMRFAISYAKSMEPLLINMEEDFIDFVGTRWAIHDLYRAMLEAYGDDMSYFAREDIEVVPDLPDEILREAGFKFEDRSQIVGKMQPIFPKKFSLKMLHRLSVIDPVLYYSQYKNNPIADGIKDFDATKLRWFDFDSVGNIVYRDERGLIQRWTRDQLDVVMVADPNSGELTATDFPAIGVIAISPRDQLFALEMWSRRVAPDAFVDMIFDLWQRWQPRVLGIEKAGQQTTAFYFKKKTKELGVYINVQNVTPKNRHKPERIRKALQPVVNQSRMFVRKSQTVLRHQVQFHPDLDNDDEIDTVAYATELLRSPQSRREQDEEDEAVKTVLRRRSGLTGY